MLAAAARTPVTHFESALLRKGSQDRLSYTTQRGATNLSNRPITGGGTDGSNIHLQEEVAEGGIRRRTLELNAQGLGQHSVVTPSKTLQIPEALAFAQDAEHCHQQEVPGRDANPRRIRASGIALR